MIKTLKGYICLTMLLSSFGSFAYTDTDSCRMSAIELINQIQSIMPRPDEERLINILQTAVRTQNNFPKNLRCVRNIDKIRNSIYTFPTNRLPAVLNELREDITNGNG